MANENLAAAVNFATVNAGELLLDLESKIRAQRAVEEGGPDGMIQTLGFVPQKDQIDEVGPFARGRDKIRDLHLPETISSGRPMAYKGRGLEGPRKLFTVVEYGNRLDGSTGDHSLAGLGRLAVAVTAIAAERTGADMQTILVADGRQPVVFEEDTTDSVEVMAQYDRFVADARATRTKPSKSPALAEALKELIEEGPDPQLDGCLVVSDFLTSAQRNRKGQLQDFAWRLPLQALEEQLGDRMFAVRLASPAQVELPQAARFNGNGRPVELDTVEYRTAAERYGKLGIEKQTHIDRVLQGIRHLNYSALTQTPTSDMIDFVFGTPTEEL